MPTKILPSLLFISLKSEHCKTFRKVTSCILPAQQVHSFMSMLAVLSSFQNMQTVLTSCFLWMSVIKAIIPRKNSLQKLLCKDDYYSNSCISMLS